MNLVHTYVRRFPSKKNKKKPMLVLYLYVGVGRGGWKAAMHGAPKGTAAVVFKPVDMFEYAMPM